MLHNYQGLFGEKYWSEYSKCSIDHSAAKCEGQTILVITKSCLKVAKKKNIFIFLDSFHSPFYYRKLSSFISLEKVVKNCSIFSS